jgi:hypothetical protein
VCCPIDNITQIAVLLIVIPSLRCCDSEPSRGIAPRLRGTGSQRYTQSMPQSSIFPHALVLPCAPQTARDPSAAVGMTESERSIC